MSKPGIWPNQVALRSEVELRDKVKLQNKIAFCVLQLQQERSRRRQLGQLLHHNIKRRLPATALALALAVPCYFYLHNWLNRQPTAAAPQHHQQTTPARRWHIQSFFTLLVSIHSIWQTTKQLVHSNCRPSGRQNSASNIKKSA